MQQAKKAEFAPFDASGWRLGIVTAQFNADITSQLEQSALQRAEAYSISNDQIDVVPVAGAIEIPLVLQQMAKNGTYTALLAIGCVIKGETPHFEYVCKFVTEGILQVQLSCAMPIGFGVLTCNNLAEATSRANLGGEHLDAILHQAKALKQI
jgi:6,7-dimethyl-8-ribityllumazine synthase